MAAAMLILGLGIGSSMQILTIVVQNTVRYEDLGVATSGVTFFRTLGSSFGAAVFGTVYANVLKDELPKAIAASPGVNPAAVTTPEALHAYPASQIAPIVDAYAHAVHVIFLAAVPVPIVAFVLALFLKQVPLRGTARDTASDVGEGFGMPEGSDASQQLQLAIGRLTSTKAAPNYPASEPARELRSTPPTPGLWASSTCAAASAGTLASRRSAIATTCLPRCSSQRARTP
jgi:hypothetical protein